MYKDKVTQDMLIQASHSVKYKAQAEEMMHSWILTQELRPQEENLETSKELTEEKILVREMLLTVNHTSILPKK